MGNVGHSVNARRNLGDSHSIRPTENPRIGQRNELEYNSGHGYSCLCHSRSHNEIEGAMRSDIDHGNSENAYVYWRGFGGIRSIPGSHSTYARWIRRTAHALGCDIDMHGAIDIADFERHSARDQDLPFRPYRNSAVASMLEP